MTDVGPLDCGPAALSALARAHAIEVSVRDLCDRLPYDARGSSLLELVDCARSLGLDAIAVETGLDHLDDLPLPFVAHLDDHHWVLVTEITQDAVVLEDPRRGTEACRRYVFAERWSGFAMVVQSD